LSKCDEARLKARISNHALSLAQPSLMCVCKGMKEQDFNFSEKRYKTDEEERESLTDESLQQGDANNSSCMKSS